MIRRSWFNTSLVASWNVLVSTLDSFVVIGQSRSEKVILVRVGWGKGNDHHVRRVEHPGARIDAKGPLALALRLERHLTRL